MEELSKVLKTVIEKHLLPTVCAVVLMLTAIALLPSDYWLIEKLGIDWFRILLFGAFFLLCKFIAFLAKTITSKTKDSMNKRRMQAEAKEQGIKAWQDLFDNLTPYELTIVKELVGNGNRPIEREGLYGMGMHSSFLSNRYRSMPWGGFPILGGDDFQNEVYICTIKYAEEENSEKESHMVYKLQDDAYNAAKYIMNARGRISTYEEL